eukprot:c20662_g1_i1.p1 GENE.c20662_g1_i1~~c20662_g1_i1.p1  ORF type:complete len:373 (+),score=157.06 c20662_g1_i1:23-1141(+)
MGASLAAPVKCVAVERHGSQYFDAAVAEMQGWRTNHEDAHICRCDWKEKVAFFAVFDGHSGAGAASYCSSQFLEEFNSLTQPFQDEEIEARFLELDGKLRLYPTFDGSGTTCVSAIVSVVNESDGTITYQIKVANAGDSRAVLIKQSGEILATNDHKPNLETEKERIEKAGGFVTEDGPARVDGMLAVSRGFGDYQYKNSTNLSAVEQKVSPKPDIYTWTAVAGDILVLACDGIFDVATNTTLKTLVTGIVATKENVGDIATELVETCLVRGSHDNMTACVVLFRDGTKNNKRPLELKLGPYVEVQNETVKKAYQTFSGSHGFDLDKDLLSCVNCKRYFSSLLVCEKCQQANHCGNECLLAHEQVCSSSLPN